MHQTTTVNSVYKDHTRECGRYEQLRFIHRLKLYSLMEKLRLSFIDNDLLYRGAL